MPLRRTLVGSIVATGLIIGLTSCGSDDDASRSTPVSNTPSSPTSTAPTSTPVDPTATAKAKVLADYQAYVAFFARGLVSNNPTYPYEQMMTGNALKATKSVTTGMQISGRKFSGTYKYLKGSVTALNLKAKPATATVQACAMDSVILRDKKGKALTSPAKVATNDRLVLTGGRWKVTETTTLDEHGEGCTS
jgi:hypothetical protein